MSVSNLAIPALVGFVIIYALATRCEVYGNFALGAQEGLMTAVKIVPQLVGLLVAIKMFTASGAMNVITKIISPLTDLIRFPREAIPFALLRPVSGSGSLAMATEIFAKHGADSFAGKVVSVMMGSTETTFYAVTVYFGAVGAKNTRHTIACALFADLVSMVMSVVVCSFM